ncbi:MAG: hypothetical protein K0R57_3835 [Paenibacillaceae bacterium]|nr:hypothetical protein [Paenibacillaceae bacterium]
MIIQNKLIPNDRLEVLQVSHTIIRRTLTGLSIVLGVVAGIILLSSLHAAFRSKMDLDHLYIYTYPERATLEEVVNSMRNTRIADAKSGLVEVPAGQAAKYRGEFLLKHGVRAAMMVASPPTFTLTTYKNSVISQVKRFAHGDFGMIYLQRAGPKEFAKTLGDYLGIMLRASMKYYLPGLLTGVAVGYMLAVAGAVLPWLGRVFDAVHSVLMGIPDFFIVVLLQLLGIYLVKWTGDQVFKILEYNTGTPFIIPFVTISVFPAVLVYGTMRLAIEREWEENYILTAYSKGIPYPRIITRHILRNTREDLFSVLPKTITVSMAAMVVAEGLCHIVGIGGYYINPKFAGVSSLPATCIILGGIALLLQLLIHLLRLRLTVRTKEAV